jgi:DNA-binding response OmpR family regulator
LTEDGYRLSGLRQVLLIDDNPLQLSVREAILRNAGFLVSVATTGESALAILRALSDRIGVIVTDHLMPGCSGSELVRQIRADNNPVPVIVLSGLAEAESEYKGLDILFRHKPLPPPELIELVRMCMESPARCQGAA